MSLGRWWRENSRTSLPQSAAPVVVPRSTVEIWNNEIRTSASSPILVGDRVFVTSEVGYLVDVDASDGRVLWKLQLGMNSAIPVRFMPTAGFTRPF